MFFIVTGLDGTDAGAAERRKAARAEHLEGVAAMVESGMSIMGAAILDDDGAMIGSVMTLSVESREQLDEWLSAEAYVVQKIWKTVTVVPCAIPPIFLK